MSGLIGSFNYLDFADSNPLAIPLHSAVDTDSNWLSPDGRCWFGAIRSPLYQVCSTYSLPVKSHCGRFTLILDGIIYNHHHVRRGLRYTGWSGNSSSETLVEGLAQRGPAILLELRGAFAFAAYDSFKQQLLLARDRLGLKTLFLSWNPYGLTFASERSAIPSGFRTSPQTVSQLLAFGHGCTTIDFPRPDTQGIVSLSTGSVVRINHSRPHDPVRFWPPQPRPSWSPLPIRDRRWAQIFLRKQLEEVVGNHLVHDLPVACLLSSGFNSGIVASLACRIQARRVSTFTVRLPNSTQEDLSHARETASHCGSHHYELALSDEGCLTWLEDAVTKLDLPSADAIKSYLVSRLVSEQGIKYALSGLGASALFGVDSSRRILFWLKLLEVLPDISRQLLLKVFFPRLSRNLSGLPQWNFWYLALALRRLSDDSDLHAAGAECLQWPESPPQHITQSCGQIIWADLLGHTEPMHLRTAHQMNALFGLELSMPYLDHQLVEIVLRMPQRYQRPRMDLLRLTCIDLLPRSSFARPRQNLDLPMAEWMRGPLDYLCKQRLGHLEASGWLHPSWIRHQWQAFTLDQLEWPKAWALVMLGEFARREHGTTDA